MGKKLWVNNMRKTIRKYFWAWQFDKEEKWLTEMASIGLVLDSVDFGKYTFKECLPGEYSVRLELLENLPNHVESQQYIRFLEDTGVQYVGSIIRWVYFKKKTEQGEFDLYSDNSSRIKHLSRIIFLILIPAFFNVFIGISNLGLIHGRLSTIPVGVGLLNLALGIFLLLGCLSLYKKRRKLVKLQNVFE